MIIPTLLETTTAFRKNDNSYTVSNNYSVQKFFLTPTLLETTTAFRKNDNSYTLRNNYSIQEK